MRYTADWDPTVPLVTDDELASTLAMLGGSDLLDKACLNGEPYENMCALHRQPRPEGTSAATAAAVALGITECEAWGIMSGWDFGVAMDNYRTMTYAGLDDAAQDALFERGVKRGRRLAELVGRGIVYNNQGE